MNDIAQRRILLIVGSAAGIALLARMTVAPTDKLRKPGQVVRIVAGGFVVSVALMALTGTQPEFATALAYLVLLGSVYEYGTIVLEKYTKPLTGQFTIVTAEEYKKGKK